MRIPPSFLNKIHTMICEDVSHTNHLKVIYLCFCSYKISHQVGYRLEHYNRHFHSLNNVRIQQAKL